MNFIVISAGRSGSSLLASALDQHPVIICADEILHTTDRSRQKHYARVFEDGRWLPARQRERTRDWLLDFYERAHQKAPVVGFKHVYEIIDMFGHWDLVSSIPDLRIVHLIRNPLMSHISFQEAKDRDLWHRARPPASVRTTLRRVTTPDKLRRISLYPAEVVLWVRAIVGWRERVRAMDRPTLEVSYSEPQNSVDAAANRVFGFLGVGASPVGARFEKTGDPDPDRRVENWEAFSEALPAEFHWLLEDLV